MSDFNMYWRREDNARFADGIMAKAEGEDITIVLLGPPPGTAPYGMMELARMFKMFYQNVYVGSDETPEPYPNWPKVKLSGASERGNGNWLVPDGKGFRIAKWNLYLSGVSAHVNGSWFVTPYGEEQEPNLKAALDYSFDLLTKGIADAS